MTSSTKVPQTTSIERFPIVEVTSAEEPRLGLKWRPEDLLGGGGGVKIHMVFIPFDCISRVLAFSSHLQA